MNDLHGLATRALSGLDPEDAHNLAIRGLKLGLGPIGGRDDPLLATDLAGLSLPNPIGLAPGFDKNAEVFAPTRSTVLPQAENVLDPLSLI